MIRIVIADDHAVVRSGIRQIVATAPDLQVCGEATEGGEVPALLRSGATDLLVTDLSMPGGGLDLIRRVRTEWPRLPILVLSMHDETQIVARALKTGAAGYVTKDSEPEILIAAIRKVAGGGRFIDPALVDALVFEGGAEEHLPHSLLSRREYEILVLLAGGKSINDIAAELHLSAKTVSTHKARLMEKLSIGNNAALIRYAIRHQLVPD
jgi:DNA-binding NarL/FixJ family response regulator